MKFKFNIENKIEYLHSLQSLSTQMAVNETTRQKKVARLLQKDVGVILQIDKKNIVEGAFVSVTDVTVSPDLSIATVYLSMMLVEKKDQLLDTINSRKNEIRRELGLKIGKQMRVVPDLLFVLDELQEKASRLDQLIDNLKIPPAPPEDQDSKN